MIKLDISVFLFLYLLVTVISVLVLWVFFGYRKKEVVFKKDEDYMRRCLVCMHTYIDSSEEEFSRCPQCASLSAIKK